MSLVYYFFGSQCMYKNTNHTALRKSSIWSDDVYTTVIGDTGMSNTFDEHAHTLHHLSPVHTGDRVDCCRNRRQIDNKVDCRRYCRLCCLFWRQIGNNLNSTARRCRNCRQLGRLCSRYGRLCRLSTKSTELNSTLSPVCTGLYTIKPTRCAGSPYRLFFI